MDSEEAHAADAAAAAAGGRDTDMPLADDVAMKELNEMKKRLKEMEEEAAALRELQAKIDAAQDPANVAALQVSKLEADSRSVYVGNVDYSCTAEKLHQHFESCGTINRVTIPTDTFGQPKGFAYVEFQEVDAVQNAVLLHETELHGRQLKVVAKRTNVPGMKHFPCRLFSPHMGYGYRMPYRAAGFDSAYGYGVIYKIWMTYWEGTYY